MRFLFDQSADFRLIPHPTGLGHDVQAISRNYPHGLPDDDVLKIDRNERKILISFDVSKVAPKHAVWLQNVEQSRVGRTQPSAILGL